jgi:hypothetical protein
VRALTRTARNIKNMVLGGVFQHHFCNAGAAEPLTLNRPLDRFGP